MLICIMQQERRSKTVQGHCDADHWRPIDNRRAGGGVSRGIHSCEGNASLFGAEKMSMPKAEYWQRQQQVNI